MNINLLGIDIAKNVFQLHGVDHKGNAVLKKRISRDRLANYVANIPQCTIAMESCGGANYWARVFQRAGHNVKLISPQFVKPFVKSNKNDAIDAQAITEAAARPSMNYVPVKQVEQQDIQSLHRIRSRLVKNRTALINEIRGLNLEYGVTIPVGASKVKKRLKQIVSDYENELTPATREFMNHLYDELVEIEDRLKKMDKKIQTICKESETCQRLQKIPGIGALTASILIATISDPTVFKNGRHMSAWLGLVPRQASSGDKQKLLGISKKGDRYLRTLMIHGARAALSFCKNLDNEYGRWITDKKTSMSFNKAAVALANKNARIVWAILKSGSEFDFNSNLKSVA